MEDAKIFLIANADASRIFKKLFFDTKDDENENNEKELTNFLKNIRSNSQENHRFFRERGKVAYNDQYGYYYFDGDDRKFFFSGMLTQSRALDNDSYDRLKKDILAFKNFVQ